MGKSVVNREVEAETGVLSPMVDTLQRYLQQMVEKVEQTFLSAHIHQTEITETRVRERNDSPPSPPLEKGRRYLLNHHSAGEAFYNASPFRLRDLTSRARQQQLKADFEVYLDGFSPNVLEVLERLKFRNQIPELVENDLLGFLLEKFLDPSINLSPKPVLNADGSVRLETLDNHGMGTVFEELIRHFNEENNEEAGEHFTPRDVVRLMARLIFIPVADEVKSGTYLVYDGACGTGGMLTVAEETLTRLAVERVAAVLGDGPHIDFNQFLEVVAKYAPECGVKLTAGRKKLLQTALATRDEAAEPVIKKIHRPGNVEPDPIRDRVETTMDGRHCIVEYEHDSELRDTEQVPLLEDGGIESFLRREVLPYASDAWYDPASLKVGYEISFTRYFYKPQPMRTQEEIRADILALEWETEGLLGEILGE